MTSIGYQPDAIVSANDDMALGAIEALRSENISAGKVTVIRELPDAKFIAAFPVLEELRAVKDQQELRHIKDGAAAIVDAMLATFRSGSPGLTEAELVERRYGANVRARSTDTAYARFAG